MSVGRNIPCPCGSGKKFKKCCYKVASAPMQKAMAKAAEVQARGESAEFKKLELCADLYKQQLSPEHPFYAALNDAKIGHGQLIKLAKQYELQDYVDVAEPLYEAWQQSL